MLHSLFLTSFSIFHLYTIIWRSINLSCPNKVIIRFSSSLLPIRLGSVIWILAPCMLLIIFIELQIRLWCTGNQSHDWICTFCLLNLPVDWSVKICVELSDVETLACRLINNSFCWCWKMLKDFFLLCSTKILNCFFSPVTSYAAWKCIEQKSDSEATIGRACESAKHEIHSP